MIPLLAWFVLIAFLALLAFLAIKFLVLRILLALIICLPILLTVAFIALSQSPVTDTNKDTYFQELKIVSERGEIVGKTSPNTITAYKQAKTSGADTIFMDVRITKDGMLIIFENASVVGTDNITYAIVDTHWAQLSKLVVHSSDNTSFLTFDNAVSWCESNKMKMMWHIPLFSADLLTYLRNKILQDGLYSQVAVTTSNFITALQLRLKDSQLLIGFLWGSTENSIVDGVAAGSTATQWIYSTLDSLAYWGVRSTLLPQFLGFDFLLININDADKSLIDDVSALGIKSIVNELSTQQQKAYFTNQLKLPFMTSSIRSTSNSKTNATVV